MQFKKKQLVRLMSLSTAAVVISITLTGCILEKEVTGVEFTNTPRPVTDGDMVRTYSKTTAIVSYSDGTTKEYPLSYQKLFGVKDRVGGNAYPAGQLYARDGSPIMDPYGQPVIAETPDGNSLLQVEDRLFLVTHYEYDWLLSDGAKSYKTEDWYSRMPMSMTLTHIEQDENTGILSAVEQRPIDFSAVGGVWIPCFASQTPWNTHLGSEEDYDLDARTIETGSNDALAGMDDLYFGAPGSANPYHYGHFPEITVAADGNTDVVKHYAMGRATWEMAMVMPDERTTFAGDDGKNTGLFMFVADRKADLSAGTLYAAKWTQTSAANGGAATLSWIRLGHATDAEIKALADSTTFSDIFEFSPEPAEGFKAIRAGSKTTEYLKLKPGMEKAAAFLETRRYAAYLGATTEFNKMEGVAVNGDDKRVYVAISKIKDGMLEDPTAPADDIRLPKLSAGATYEMTLAGNQTDSEGNPIDSDWVGTAIHVPAALLGEEIAVDEQGNTANPDRIANPDNVFFSARMRTLFIGEDSGMHVNNYVWAYNVDTGKLSRILSLMAGAEATGLQAVENIGDYSYIMSNAQHQGDFIKTMNEELKSRLADKIDRFDAPVGYIKGLPRL